MYVSFNLENRARVYDYENERVLRCILSKILNSSKQQVL